MKIANPVYDVVFKYLMDDNKIVKSVIPKIIRRRIESIDFQPKESVVKVGASSNEDDFPEEYKDISRKLQKATVDVEIQDIMNIEGKIVLEIPEREREIETLKESLSDKDKEVERLKKLLGDK